MRVCITVVVISPLVAPGIPKSSIFHFSFYLDLGCDESEICLSSLEFSGGRSHQKVMRWLWWGIIFSFPALVVWTSNTPFIIPSLDLLVVFLLIQPRVQLIFAARMHGWFLFKLFTRISRSFSAEFFSISSLSCCMGLSMPEAGLCLWTSRGPGHPAFPACWDSPEQQLHLPVYCLLPQFGLICEPGETVICPVTLVVSILRY